MAAQARDPGRGPSRHSETSRSSEPVRSRYVRSGSMRGSIIDRKRINQPQGYQLGAHHNAAPITHFCLRHNYLYYPERWTDEATGREYEQGYYDENGQYYEDVAFLEDGKYKNVVCQCEYCDTITKIDWTEGGTLICAQCGGSMKILSALDEYTQDPGYDAARQQPGYLDYADRNTDPVLTRAEPTQSGGKNRFAPWVFGITAILAVAAIIFAVVKIIRIRNTDLPAEPELYGNVLYLRQSGADSYVISDSGNYDKLLRWDSDADSYYDGSELWLWYNTEVEPPLWQYWYEPISEYYGDYGWMEYEDGTWYVEADQGQWIDVPLRFDTSELWHIDTSSSGASNGSADRDAPADSEAYDDDSPEDLGGSGASNGFDDDDTPEDVGSNGGYNGFDDDTDEDIG